MGLGPSHPSVGPSDAGNEIVTLRDIPNWTTYSRQFSVPRSRSKDLIASVNPKINSKISLYYGTITRLKIDAIVNAANSTLLGGGGIDGAIHRAAGPLLHQECRTLRGCPTGQTKLTHGYDLPSKFVLHTVGPTRTNDSQLESCYRTILDHVSSNRRIRSVAFCCVSTGIFGFPLIRATKIALGVVRRWMEEKKNLSKVVRIIFCVFLEKEKDVYEYFLPRYFPVFGAEEEEGEGEGEGEGESGIPPLQSEEPPKQKKRRGWGMPIKKKKKKNEDAETETTSAEGEGEGEEEGEADDDEEGGEEEEEDDESDGEEEEEGEGDAGETAEEEVEEEGECKEEEGEAEPEEEGKVEENGDDSIQREDHVGEDHGSDPPEPAETDPDSTRD